MTIADWLFATMEKLGHAGVDSPRRDALVLLEDTLGKDRSWVLAHSEYKLSEAELLQVSKLIERRITREPLAYIRGKAWFYGRFFEVNEHVLIPRPESEDIIELAKKADPKIVFDIGTGSGCLGITLALEIPGVDMYATDISEEALEVCRKNSYAHNVRIHIKNAYLVDSLLETIEPDLIIANLPYVPEDLITSPEITHEPAEALFAGKDGMDVYQNFWGQILTAVHKPRYILTESLETQHNSMNGLAAKSGYVLLKTEGLIQKWERSR